MCAGSVHHVTEIVKLVAEVFLFLPTLLARPCVWMLGIDGAGGVEIAVRLLRSANDVEHAVNVSLELLVGIGLKDVAGTLDGLIHVGVVKRESHKLSHVPFRCLQSCMARMLERVSSHVEVLIAVFALTLRESKGHGHLAGSLETCAPERVLRHLHTCERHLRIGIAVCHHLRSIALG